jgi:hypothetical protein
MRKQRTTEAPEHGGSPEAVTDSPEERQRTQALAYQLWLQRGCPVGSDQDDWYKAELQLLQLRRAFVRQAANVQRTSAVTSTPVSPPIP